MVSTIPEKIERIKNIVLSKKLKKFKITASIDGIGSEQEYTRYGFKFQEFQKNLDFIVKQKWIEVNLNQTISSLTIKTIKNLYQQIYHKNDYHKVSITFGLVVGHPYLHPKIFGSNFWRKDAEEILSLMPENNEIQKISKGYMKSIFSFIESCDKDLDQIQNLKLYLDEIDRRRNLDWRKTFPYLDVKI